MLVSRVVSSLLTTSGEIRGVIMSGTIMPPRHHIYTRCSEPSPPPPTSTTNQTTKHNQPNTTNQPTNHPWPAAGLPQPFDPTQYFYAYVCKKAPLVLPTTKGEKVRLPESWRKAAKETAER